MILMNKMFTNEMSGNPQNLMNNCSIFIFSTDLSLFVSVQFIKKELTFFFL